MTTRRTWPAQETLRIVLEGLYPNASVEAVCRAHGIHSSQFYKWKDQALAATKTGLED